MITTDFVLVWLGVVVREGLRVGVLVGVPLLVLELVGVFVAGCDREGEVLGATVREEVAVLVPVREGVGVGVEDGRAGDRVLTERALRKRISQSWYASSSKL